VGILDVTSTVLTQFKADTRQHKQAIKSLKGVEKERSKALIDGMENENAKLDAQAGRLKKVAIAVGVVTGAYLALKKGFEVYATRQQMLAAGAGKNLEALRKASQGLITDTDLLTIESGLLNGAVKLTGEQMEDVVRFMLALRKQGNNLKDVQREVTKAFVELNVEGLKKYGIATHAAVGTTEAFVGLLKEANVHVDNFGGDLGIKGDNVRVTMVNLKNATDDLVLKWGTFSSVVLPYVIAGLNKILDGFNKIGRVLDKLRGDSGPHMAGVAGDPVREKAIRFVRRKVQAPLRQMAEVWPMRGVTPNERRNFTELLGGMMAKGRDPQKLAQQKIKGWVEAGKLSSQDGAVLMDNIKGIWVNTIGPLVNAKASKSGAKAMKAQTAHLRKTGGTGKGTGKDKGTGRRATGSTLDPFDELLIDIDRPLDIYRDLAVPGGQGSKGKFGGFTGGTGTGADMDSSMKQMIRMTDIGNTLRDTMDGLTDALAGAFGAWVAGTESFTGAFKKMTISLLQNLAMEEGVMAIKSAAMAITNLAYGDFRGAALHGKAAAMHAAVAGTAGLFARGLGGSAPTTPNTAAGASGAGGGSGPRSQTIILGADFETDSARRRSHRLASILQQADMGGASVVEFG